MVRRSCATKQSGSTRSRWNAGSLGDTENFQSPSFGCGCSRYNAVTSDPGEAVTRDPAVSKL